MSPSFFKKNDDTAVVKQKQFRPSKETSEILKNTKIPILLLDSGWLEYFTEDKKTKKIIQLEEQLKELLKVQGRMNDEFKKLTALKKELMQKIILLTTEAFSFHNHAAKEEMEKSQKYILQINERLIQLQEQISNHPNELDRVNGLLFEECIIICYEEMRVSKVQLDMLTPQIDILRERLKKIVDEKVHHEDNYQNTYVFLNNMAGQEIINILDKDYSG